MVIMITPERNTPISIYPEYSQTFPVILRLSLTYASYTLVVYDYICTVEKEIRHVWPCSWSTGLFLFYINRYLPFIELILIGRRLISPTISQGECLWIYPLTIWLQTIGMIISLVIVILRTYAIWSCCRLIFWILVPLATFTFGSMLSLTAWQTAVDYHRLRHVMVDYDQPLPNNIQCQISALPFDTDSNGLILLIMFLVVFLSEGVVFVLTIIKAKEHVSQISNLWINKLYNNGIICCACMLILSLANSVVTFAAPPSYKYFLLNVQRGLHSVFANRVILLILEHRHVVGSEQNGYAAGRADLSDTSIYLDTISLASRTERPEADVPALPWRITRVDEEWIF